MSPAFLPVCFKQEVLTKLLAFILTDETLSNVLDTSFPLFPLSSAVYLFINMSSSARRTVLEGEGKLRSKLFRVLPCSHFSSSPPLQAFLQCLLWKGSFGGLKWCIGRRQNAAKLQIKGQKYCQALPSFYGFAMVST